jgi:zinc protease
MSWVSGVQVRRLPNGLTAIVQSVPGLPAAAIVSRVGAGFFDEPDSVAGISHVLEHMFFKGTPSRGVGEIARATKALGGYLNAGTAYDYTVYYAVLPVRGLAEAVTIQADALRNPLIDAGELAREIVVILEEARRKLDTPSAVAHESLHALLFDHHRIRRWRIGHEPVLAALTRNQLLAYHATRYVPSRTVVVVAGGVEPGSTLDLLERHYGDWPSGTPQLDPSPPEPPRRERRVQTLRGDVKQSDVVVGWRGVPALHPDETALELAAAVLSAGRASRLYRGLREPGLVSSVGAWSYTPTEVGVFGVSMDLDPIKVSDAIRAVAREVKLLALEGPGSEELDRARILLRAQWARRFESADGRAMELAAAQALGDIALLDREYRRLLTTTAEEVREVVRRHLDPAAVSAVAYLPQDRGEDLALELLGEAFDAVPARSRTPEPAPLRPAPALSVVTRPAGPVIAGVHHLALPGADLLVARHAGAPLVSLGLYRRRTAFDRSDQAGLAVLAVRSAVRGAGDLDAAALADSFERLGGTLGPSVNTEWYGYHTSVLVEHLDPAAALLDLVLRHPRLAETAVGVERQVLADDAEQANDDMQRRPTQLAAAAAFGAAGYGLPLLGTPRTVRGLGVEQVTGWHTGQAGARLTVVAVGDLDPERAIDRLAGRFGDLPAAPDTAPAPVPAPADDDRPWQLVETRDKAQTALTMLFPGPTRLDPDRHAAEVWAAHAGGLGGRLFEALRDRLSLAYTVAAYPWQRRRLGALITYIATSPTRETEAREAMLRELEGLVTTPAAEEEIQRAASYVAGQTEVARQRGAAVMAEILDAWLEGTGLAELEDPTGPYLAVTADQVRSLAARYLDPARRAEGVVRGKLPD